LIASDPVSRLATWPRISAARVFGYGKSAIRERSFKNGRLEKTLPFIGFREPA